MPETSSAASRPWAAFAALTAAAGLTILDLSKVNVGLPAIERSLGTTPTELQLVVSGYALAFGIALIPSGRLGDLGWRKRLLLLGLGLFAVASGVSALAPNPAVLLSGRIAQGVAAGVLMPQVIGMIQQLFTPAERGRAFGVFGGTIGVATALGPALGGLLVTAGGEIDGWRLLFWMNVPLCAVTAYAGWRLLPSAQPLAAGDLVPERRTLDPAGILLIAVTTVSLLIPFAFTTGRPSDDPHRWWWLLGAAGGFVVFIAWEKAYEARGKAPVVYLRLLRIASYRNGLVVITGFFTATPALLLVVTLVLQQGLGWSPAVSGAAAMPYALSAALGSWWSGSRSMKNGRMCVIVGLSMTAAGAAVLAAAPLVLDGAALGWTIVATFVIIGLGSGVVVSPNQTLLLAEIPVTRGGVAGSVSQLGQRVGTAIGVAIISAVFFSALGNGDYKQAMSVGMLVAAAILLIPLSASIYDWTQHRGPVARAARE